jgi:NAD(P)-dependent dehydrogenase (short-subunit alcohol dehydrogenase family)
MKDALGFEGKNVVVTGAAQGMGGAATQILCDLGANVIGIDIKPVSAPVQQYINCDLNNEESINSAIAAITQPLDAVLSCAGLPGPPFSNIDIFTVNFIGGRHLIEGLVPKMNRGGAVGCIASAAAVGWQFRLALCKELFEITDFAKARQWYEAQTDFAGFGAYTAAKWALNCYGAYRSHDFMREYGVRLNVTNPGPTDTAMMPNFIETNTLEAVDHAMGSIGRHSSAEEQAWPLVMLCSPRMSYVVGESFWVDGGYLGPMQAGRIEGYNFLLNPL